MVFRVELTGLEPVTSCFYLHLSCRDSAGMPPTQLFLGEGSSGDQFDVLRQLRLGSVRFRMRGSRHGRRQAVSRPNPARQLATSAASVTLTRLGWPAPTPCRYCFFAFVRVAVRVTCIRCCTTSSIMMVLSGSSFTSLCARGLRHAATTPMHSIMCPRCSLFAFSDPDIAAG